MLVVAIVGILAGIAIPQFADIMRKSYEARTKANLGVIRSALAIYYGDTEGLYPTDSLQSLVPRYLAQMPLKYTPPYHPEGNDVSSGNATDMITARGDWFYFSTWGDNNWGQVVVNCVHQDLNGRTWATY